MSNITVLVVNSANSGWTKIPLFEIRGGMFNTSQVFQPSNGHGRCNSLRKRQLGWGKTNKDPQILLFVRSFFFIVFLLYQL